MRKLNNNELSEVVGGGISYGLGLILGAVATFIVGVIDGIFRPLKCN